MNEKEKKALPFDTAKGFSAVPSVIFTLYTKHPDFDAYALMVYAYILRRYNDKYGFAFPTVDEIAYTLHISDTTVKRAIKTLKKLGLIRVERNAGFLNNVYYFEKPVEDEAEFFARFKEVEEAEREHAEKWEKISQRRKADKEKYRKSLGEKQSTPPKTSGPVPLFDPDEVIKLW
ncbi:helix-turn-helix domain-containing protein [Geobacillus sp. MR]|uniref:helix-turn-helix domain-containing protein n=1 Tax=Geobacillus sp. MR TaxID=2508875 RepID=UPI00148DF584|nr:helix-turn-helix domain-containing protein [Geobacillus sp. MR]NNU88692.1 helix-turn-helix domain-containing protein [Geobacillus sp. MR]